jgi:hypothetical protein
MKLEHVQFGFHEHKTRFIACEKPCVVFFFFKKKNNNVSTIVSENINKRMISNNSQKINKSKE